MSNIKDAVQKAAHKSGADSFVENYTQQLLLNPSCDWGDLLNAAPRALVSLGQAFVAASSTAASSSVQIRKESGLQYTSLRANLQHCADLGQEAFLEAEAKMQSVAFMAKFVTETGGSIDKIVHLCNNENLAKRDLPRQIERLRKISGDCVKNTEIVQEKFEAWADLAAALKRACTASSDDTRNTSQQVAAEAAKKEQVLDFKEEEIKAAKKRTEEQKARLKIHENDMVKAQNKVPKGWNAVGIRVADAALNGVGSVVEGTAAAIAALTAFVAAGGPTLNLKLSKTSSDISQHERKRSKKPKKKNRGVLQLARENYIASQEAYLRSQGLLSKLEERDEKEKEKFNNIQLDLQKLSHENVSLDQIMGVLNKCVQNLVEFNNHITQLRQFFNGLHVFVENIDKQYAGQFLSTAEQFKEIGPADREARTDYLKEIQLDALRLRGSYLMAGELTSTYVVISKKHIMPGVHLVNTLMLSDSDSRSGKDVTTKVKQITTFARRAQHEVSLVATKRREAVRDQLFDIENMIHAADTMFKVEEMIDESNGGSIKGSNDHTEDDDDDKDDDEDDHETENGDLADEFDDFVPE